MSLERMFSKTEHLYVYETYQFNVYSKYVSDAFDEDERRHIGNSISKRFGECI
ncbi:hypothetical protein [Methanobrevibacter sp.]|uniref:hypothetical protein n=1 Tax=Methanobrevibacter sp. TaxID=66852 RepID=UPI00388E34C2